MPGGGVAEGWGQWSVADACAIQGEFKCVSVWKCLDPNDSKSGRDIGLFSLTA